MAEARRLSISALKRLMTEERNINEDKTIKEFVARPKIVNKEKDYKYWDIYIRGTKDSLYEGTILQATLEFPREYPIFPPKMKFVTEMFHPNIYKDGSVCISMLHATDDDPSGYERPDEKWSPVYGVQSVIISVLNLLNEPNTESPANVDASALYKKNYEKYCEYVKKLAKEKSVKIPE